MSNPKHTIFWMLVYLIVVGAICVLLFRPLESAFMANWVFNGLILGVLCVGVLITFRQVMILKPELEWIKVFRTGQTGLSVTQEPRLLKPLAKSLDIHVKHDRFSMSALSLRTVLDGIRTRLDESREISRYMIGLLIFLGLLGTFWGLLGTIESVGQVILGLDVGQRNFTEVFAELKGGLLKPLAGMGTAFSSSLFGLGGSLVLGFLDIQAGHAQNRFYDGLEEWLSGMTHFIDVPDTMEEVEMISTRGRQKDLSIVVTELQKENQLLRELLNDEVSRTD
ncbi:MAG: flagellar motor protein MotA [Gammaproteobacteria bacterium]|nr:flagellar motor protein MotA [Gammaproteobacteria bacterium]MCP5406513.1 flagellar motor protein MotA [Chromatiaceae bacterium]MCP5444242.1 flagellar motor protein MotA [Chromatiaceae bacterium]